MSNLKINLFSYAFESKQARDVYTYLASYVDSASKDDLIILCDMDSDKTNNGSYNYIIKKQKTSDKVSDWFWPFLKRQYDRYSVGDVGYDHPNYEMYQVLTNNNDNYVDDLQELGDEHFNLYKAVESKSLKDYEPCESSVSTLSDIITNLNKYTSFDKHKYFNNMKGIAMAYTYNSYIDPQ